MDWTLAFCDTSDIDTSGLFERTDLLYPDSVVDSRRVYYKDNYICYYLGKQRFDKRSILNLDGALVPIFD